MARWWGPRGVTNPVCEADARPGGAIHIVMLAGKELGELEGQKLAHGRDLQGLAHPRRIVFTSSAIQDDSGKHVLDNLVTMSLEKEGDKTKMTLHVLVTNAGPGSEGPLSGMEAGWTQSIDKLVSC